MLLYILVAAVASALKKTDVFEVKTDTFCSKYLNKANVNVSSSVSSDYTTINCTYISKTSPVSLSNKTETCSHWADGVSFLYNQQYKVTKCEGIGKASELSVNTTLLIKLDGQGTMDFPNSVVTCGVPMNVSSFITQKTSGPCSPNSAESISFSILSIYHIVLFLNSVLVNIY